MITKKKISPKPIQILSLLTNQQLRVDLLIEESWKKIAPFWPLKNLIAVNPLQGFEGLPIEKAIEDASVYFQQKSIPEPMERINRETIKWMQAFIDEGQATISMPNRELGLYQSWLQLAMFDQNLHQQDHIKIQWLKSLPKSPITMIQRGLLKLNIAENDHLTFLTLLLTTLPGFASHIKYQTEWSDANLSQSQPITQADYLAMRITITCLLWPEAENLVSWHENNRKVSKLNSNLIPEMQKLEINYRDQLISKIKKRSDDSSTADAQIIFCIDTRSESFRLSLEKQGKYQTYGFAGFFGIPMNIQNSVTGETYASCPVLLKPKQTIIEFPACEDSLCRKDHLGYERLNTLKKLYQSVKYTFTTPFILVESLGIGASVWMVLKTIAPKLAMNLKNRLQNKLRPSQPLKPDIDTLSIEAQCEYAEGMLNLIGLTKNFSPIVVLCGHGSTTQNNAFATALDCGACAGRHGASNARIMAEILNRPKVREHLSVKGIDIPSNSHFIAAEHNTTTDIVEIYDNGSELKIDQARLSKLKNDLETARKINSQSRAKKMRFIGTPDESAKHTLVRSLDWAQVRPEWGLARNAAFIIGPRDLTKDSDLDGRCFLHSYDYSIDPDATLLTIILTAPMIVAKWINTQYLFSTLDNVAYGAGSKVTKNISGKTAVMQGNASDLMHGLPLQSLYLDDTTEYHQKQRLLTVIYAPTKTISKVIKNQEILQRLFMNGWVNAVSIDPRDGVSYKLERDLSWTAI